MNKKVVFRNGTVASLYDDALSQTLLTTLGGDAAITRASHIEADPSPQKNIQFEVDLTPSNGPILKGFPTYKSAVEAEIKWLHENKLTIKKTKPLHQ